MEAVKHTGRPTDGGTDAWENFPECSCKLITSQTRHGDETRQFPDAIEPASESRVRGKVNTTLGRQCEIGKKSAVSDRRAIERKPVLCLGMRIEQRQEFVGPAHGSAHIKGIPEFLDQTGGVGAVAHLARRH